MERGKSFSATETIKRSTFSTNMKAFKEIGLKKTIKFVLLTFAMLLYRFMVFPPLRVLALRLLGAKVGKDVIIHKTTFFNYYRKGFSGLCIGPRAFLGEECLFDLAESILIEENTTFGPRVTVLTHLNVGYDDHPLQKAFPAFAKPTVFKQGCFIGAGSTILAGVVIGEQSFVAAGSVVTEDVPEKTLVGGVPARPIRNIQA